MIENVLCQPPEQKDGFGLSVRASWSGTLDALPGNEGCAARSSYQQGAFADL